MYTLGRHIIVECSGCSPDVLNDLDAVRTILTDAAVAAKAEVRERAFHRFSPQGVSGVIVISESHLSVHTWPEFGYAALDIYTCGEHTLPWVACQQVAKAFGATSVQAILVRRGIESRENRFSQEIISLEDFDDEIKPTTELAVVS
jgi:S-adenosylmethionine decarboxylase